MSAQIIYLFNGAATMTIDHSNQYRIFLLTFWLEDEADLAEPEQWRFRLEEPKRESRVGCVGYSTLMSKLASEIGGDKTESNK